MEIYYNQKLRRIVEHDRYSVRIHWSRQMLDDLRRMFPTTLNAELSGYLGVSQSTMLRKARELGLRKDPAWLARIWEERRQWAHMSARSKGYPGCFQKGEHPNPEGEFKPGHKSSPEANAKRAKAIRRYYRDTPARKLREKGLKAWETRMRNRHIRSEEEEQ